MDFRRPPGSLVYKGIDTPLDGSIDFRFVLAQQNQMLRPDGVNGLKFDFANIYLWSDWTAKESGLRIGQLLHK